MTAAPWEGRTVVYRLLNRHGRCIYVGCTRALASRMYQHHANTHFADEIARVQITLHPDRETALLFERSEIRRLRPRHNINGRGRRAFWHAVDFVEVIEACEARIAAGAYRTGNSPLDVDAIRAELARRFPEIARLTAARKAVA